MKKKWYLGFLAGILAAFSVNANALAEWPTLEGKTGTIRGKVYDIGGSLVILEQPVSPKEREEFIRLGYRPIQKESDVAHQTVLHDRVFILLYFDRGFWSPTTLIGLKGQVVDAQVTYDARGEPSVVSIVATKL